MRTTFGQLNVGKNSLVLDLKSPDGIEVVRRLVKSADILVENFRPGVMQRLKLDFAFAKRTQPKTDLLLDFRIRPDRTVGGTAGLRAGDPCRGRLRHGASGLSGGAKPAGLLGDLSADVLTGVYAFGVTRRALYHASRHRRGQHIDVSMLESMLSLTIERSAVVAIRGEADPASDVRADRNHRTASVSGRHRQREDLRGPDEGHRPSRSGSPIRALPDIPTAARTGPP